jgi:hypothetical protein
MANGNSSWRVLPHRPIEKLTENLWRVEGDLENMPLKRVMTVIKLSDGKLVIHNAMALSPEAMAELEGWGEVGSLIVPNGLHRIDAKRFKERYPQARVFCPVGARKKVEEVVAVDGSYAELPADSALSAQELDGTAHSEGVIEVLSADGKSLIFTDALFNMPHIPGAIGWTLRYITGSTGGLRVSRLFRLLVLKDRRAFRAHLERLAATPNLRRIIVAHHQLLTGDVATALRAVASKL